MALCGLDGVGCAARTSPAGIAGETGGTRSLASAAAAPVASGPVASLVFLGMPSGDGTAVSEQDWKGFIEDTVLPRFPQGLTVLEGSGFSRGLDGVLVNEPSKVMMVVHPPAGDANRLLDEIATAYRKRFHQEAVLRLDLPTSVPPITSAANAPRARLGPTYIPVGP